MPVVFPGFFVSLNMYIARFMYFLNLLCKHFTLVVISPPQPFSIVCHLNASNIYEESVENELSVKN